jgi:N-acetylmuramoyl-L-alanine amidase
MCKFANLMRVLFALWLVWAGISSVRSTEAGHRTPPLLFGGQEYTELQRWAEANHFHWTLSKRDKEEEVQLTNRWARLLFRPNSQRAEINGIALFLAFPLVLHQGVVYVAQRDIDYAFKPILFPAKNKLHHSVKTVAVCAGHGGKDAGFQIGSQQEKKYTLLLAKEVQELIARAGLKPVMIRTSDQLVAYDDRPKLAERGKADVYLELHYNSAGGPNNEIRGVEVYCLTPAGANSTNGGSDQYGGGLRGNRHDERNILLAYEIHRSLVDSAALVDRGVRRARFEVLRDANIPAVLIEAGFMSHAEEMRNIQDSGRRRQTAQAIVDGLLAYKRLVER